MVAPIIMILQELSVVKPPKRSLELGTVVEGQHDSGKIDIHWPH